MKIDMTPYTLEEGQEISMPEPTKKSDCWTEEFDGTFVKFRTVNGKRLAVIEDMDENCFDIEFERLLDDAKLDLDKISHLPANTPAQRRKRAELILEYYNQEVDDEDCDDREYMEGKRDGYSACLNDLGFSGN